MKIEIFDQYNIRARVCPCIILLSPVVLTLFLCFSDVFNYVTSAVIIAIFLSIANCIPVIQRMIFKRSKIEQVNYASQYLNISDTTIDSISKKRYYKKLSEYDPVFDKLNTPTDNRMYIQLCESAVRMIKSKTREQNLLLEENINYGFCKNMLLNKRYGLILCSINIIFIVVYSLVTNITITIIPRENWIVFSLTILMLLFWIFVINKRIVQESGKRYAIALIEAIDNI